MLPTGMIVAGGVVAIYIIFGPLVLLGIYVFIDRLARGGEQAGRRGSSPPEEKEPDVWSPGDVRRYLKDRKHSLFRG